MERRDYAELVQIQHYAIESHVTQMEQLRIAVGDTYLTIEDPRQRRCLNSEDELVYCIPFTGVQKRYDEVSPELRDDGTLSPTNILYGSPRFASVRNSDNWISFSGYKEKVALGGDPKGNAIICGSYDSPNGMSDIAFRFKTWLAKVLIDTQLRDW
ncbi:hypothetical protein [Tomitella cavernea]|uniref:Uncharacterized protein n=1 Tax=Tomitella cavernea TaxID=1387982 RepID=A0ABP9C806_9ACTN|nr:hypothetical protein [Tomitella cavernea]